MTVYVDPAMHEFRGMIMCHMWGDTVDELHAFAERIGLQRRWFQTPPKASWDHYDVSKGKREFALRLGAQATDIYGPSMHVARLRGQTELIARIERLRAERAPAEGRLL